MQKLSFSYLFFLLCSIVLLVGITSCNNAEVARSDQTVEQETSRSKKSDVQKNPTKEEQDRLTKSRLKQLKKFLQKSANNKEWLADDGEQFDKICKERIGTNPRYSPEVFCPCFKIVMENTYAPSDFGPAMKENGQSVNRCMKGALGRSKNGGK